MNNVKKHFPMLFKKEILKFDEEFLNIGIKSWDFDRIFILTYSGIFSCKNEKNISIFSEHPKIHSTCTNV